VNCKERDPLEEQVLDAIRPSKIQLSLLNKLYNLIKSKLESCLPSRGLRGVVEAQGSFAKGTLLSDKWEIDVFVLFEGVDDEWINSTSLKIITECLKGLPMVRRYAQHPYITVVLGGLEADIVPTIKLEKPRPKGMGVERTPFHTKYVKSRLDPCLADDVRLLKSFLKGIGAYGAETHVGGFSGYLAELLVLKYGGFKRTLEAAASWIPRVYIDLEGMGDRERLTRKYRDSPLIVVDPVDPERNAAAAVRLDKFALFILAARSYLRKPNKAFFHPFTPTMAAAMSYKVEPSRLGVILYRGQLYNYPPESVWGRLYRSARLLAGELERMGFHVARYWFHTDEASYGVVAVEVESPTLPPLQVSEGPYAWIAERADRFVSKRREEGTPVWIRDDGALVAWRPRRIQSLHEALIKASRSLPDPPGSRLYYAGPLEGVSEPWFTIIMREYLKSFPSWIVSP
jgi:tRNA nucleotidyltransferase (CCA-adding enzyme)